MTYRFILGAAAAASILTYAFAGHASPASDPDTVSVKVQLSDLDLGSQAGASEAYLRIRAAARRICGEAPAPMELNGKVYGQCMDRAIDPAVQALGNPIVTAMASGRRASTDVLASR
ncbi:MAG: UrcA family protein [Caulobacteraceae bacterium]